MAPTPQHVIGEQPTAPVTRPLGGDEVVITGLSGIFPKSNSVLEFMDNLYNKVDMVSNEDPRWIFNHPEVPEHLGKVNGMSKFDAQFFRVHYKQACTMEPMSRKLLEHAYGAIYDSGINPLQLRGRKVGVFIGSTFSESEKIVIYETIQRNGFGITGCNKAMYANRISYWIDGKGPSYALDLACASSMACLEHAYRSISTGQCDAAIVGGCNLCMHPNVSLNLKRAGFLCLDGKSKCFDKNGDGYVRSDAISVLFLQKAKDAKRIYAEVYNAKGNYGLSEGSQFMPVRHPKDIEDFLEAFYSEIDVSPKEVEYIEGHGSANAEADGNELQAVGKVFAKDKTINVGSVVSNMGHSEPASGACALTKVCLAYHKGEIPANLHYSEPQDHITPVKEGRIQVLQQNMPFNRGYTALNSFSYSGANLHVLLKGHYKKKDPERYQTNMPRIVLASGRQEDCVMKIFNILKAQPVDPEQVGLLHSIHENEIPGHMCRGYILLDTNEKNETVSLAEKVDHYPGNVRPIWFVYSGMGSQWATMGAGLMSIPIFAAAIEKCHRVLEPKGINIVKILTDPDKTIYDNILHSFVGIAAVQIGLTDILRAIGIVPDNIIGHSVGELGCAYADGCFTAEEMILSAYSRGLVSVQTPFIKGSMAAVGLGYKTILPMCPPEIEIACHNSSESSTISGPADVMKEFVAELTSKGIFAKEVPCSNIAYHSRYIADAGPALLKYLSEVIVNPKERSAKWVSTSVPQSEWEEPKAKFSSAEYHTNNLLNSVLFEETSKIIPENAIVIEIAPHGLLQAILKRSLPGCSHIPLTRRGNQDPVKYLLEAFGKLYVTGVNPKVDILYPKIEFPVSTETPLLSHFVGWEHSEDWPEAKYNTKDKVIATNRQCVMSIHDDDYKYLQGHVRNGTIVFPEAAILVLVWETLAMYLNVNYKEQPVAFKDIQFHAEATMDEEEPLRLYIMIYKGNNVFEVSSESTKIASGIINALSSSEITFRDLEQTKKGDEVTLTSDDIYKILHMRGYEYKSQFLTISSANANRTKANIRWDGDWITYLDGLLQFNALANDFTGLSTPKIIKYLTIDPEKQNKVTQKLNSSEITAELYEYHNLSRCGGIELEKIEFYAIPTKNQTPVTLQTQSFIPHFLTGIVNVNSALQINMQVIGENIEDNILNVIDMLTEPYNNITDTIKKVSEIMTTLYMNVDKIEPETIELDALVNKEEALVKSNVFVVDNLLGNKKKMRLMHNMLAKNSFVLTVEEDTSKISPKYNLFSVVTAMSVNKKILVLLKKISDDENVTYIPIIHDKKFSWVPKIQSELQKERSIVLISEKQPYCGLIGMVKKLREQYGNKIGVVVIDDYHAPAFHPENSVYQEQIKKRLAFNVLKKGQWGGYYFLPGEKSITLNNATLTCPNPGNLESLTWVEATVPSSCEALVQIHYSALSLKDVKKALGKDVECDHFGMDYSGLNSKGERVMGIVSKGSMSNTIEPDPTLLWPVPDNWTLEEAATVPLAYVHAYYCLLMRGSIRRQLPNSSVFVNGGAGALGQAIISICLNANCTVYTAVSDIKKKKFLLKLFPQLDEKNIGNSRDGTFEDMIRTNTKGAGCNFVINLGSGDMREAAMKCCGGEAVLIDVSDRDMRDNGDFGMFFLVCEKNYVALNVSNIFKSESSSERKILQWLLADGIRTGAVRPLSRVVYAADDVTRAFRLLSSSKQRGRVVIKLKDSETSSRGLSVVPRTFYSTKGCHVVICDEKGLAIELIDHLISRGARKIVINVKPNTIGGYFYVKSLSWKKLGVVLQIFNENLQLEKGCVSLLNEATKLGAVEGIFVVQNVDEAGGESFTPEIVADKFNDSAMRTANLDLMSRNMCGDLKHFVVLTRTSKEVTDEYVASVLEKICQNRNEVGLPGLVLRVGALNEFNKCATDPQSKFQLLSYSSIFNTLEASLKLNYKNVQPFNLKKRTDSDFLKKIEDILGLKNIDAIPEKLTLENMSAYDLNIEEVIAVIKETYNVYYPLDKARKLTIGDIKNLVKHDKVKTKFDSGIGAFFTFIDDDECLATEPMIAMHTKFTSATMSEEVIDQNAEYLMLIPGFEGHYQIFSSVCERLKIQATTFQLGPDLANDSIKEMAYNIRKFMKKRIDLKSKFYLLGYSFGVNVALEIAALLEKEGLVGTVFCLDSSPESLRVQLDAYVGNLSETQLQNAIVEHMYKLMAADNNEELKQDLLKTEDWASKVEACVQRLRGLVNYSNQYKKSLLNAAYKRITMAKEYKPDFKLESELVLIKGIPHPKAERLANDYGLSKYTNRTVKVYNVNADHAFAPHDSKVSNIVNQFLDPKLIEEFNKKNLCEFYFADPFKML